jgi:hypothetical protein
MPVKITRLPSSDLPGWRQRGKEQAIIYSIPNLTLDRFSQRESGKKLSRLLPAVPLETDVCA